jgi:EAL domain-containing protein (putative c-di-GMP-specific phosphodiesterase class I)
MTTDPREAAIVQSIVELGHGLGLDVVAERVETREQREALRAMNCDHGQGYLFAPPLEAERVAERLTIH